MTRSLRLLLFACLLATPAFAVPPGADELALRSAPSGARLGVGVKLISAGVRREYAGFVALALPLDAWAAPRKLAQNAERAATAEADFEPQPAPAEPDRPLETPPPKPTPAKPAVAEAPISPRAFVALTRGTVQEALLTAGAARKHRELSSLAGRARSSAMLPELRLRAARSNDEALRLAPTSGDPNRYTLDGGSDLLLEATATWKLDRLLFADEEVAIERLALERDKVEAVLVQKTLVRLFAWRRALAKSRAAELSPEERAEAELDSWEAQAELDVLTGGWFSERLLELGLSLEPEPRGAADAPDAADAAAEQPQSAPSPSEVGQKPANALNAARHAG